MENFQTIVARARQARSDATKIGQVRRLIVDNPHEEFDYEILRLKLPDIGPSHMRSIITKLQDEGVLEAVHIIRARRRIT